MATPLSFFKKMWFSQAAEERARLGQGIEDDDMSDDEEQVCPEAYTHI